MFDWLNSNSVTAAPTAAGSTAVNNVAAPAATAGVAAPTAGVSVATPTTMTTGGFSGGGFAGNANMILGGVQAIGSLWNSYQQNKIAKKQIGLQEEAFRTNLANTTKTYNTALEDRIRSRYNTEGRSSSEADQYIEKNKL